MSDYLSHIFGYVLKLFLRNKNPNKNGRFGKLKRSNSVIDIRNPSKEIIENIGNPTSTVQSKSILQRHRSCPSLEKDFQNIGDDLRRRTCPEKLILLDDSENNVEEHNLISCQQHGDSFKDLSTSPRNSVSFDSQIKILGPEAVTSLNSDPLTTNANGDFKKDSKKSCASSSLTAAGDGTYISSESFREEPKYFQDKIEIANTHSKNTNYSSEAKEDPSAGRINLSSVSANQNSTDSQYYCNFCYLDGNRTSTQCIENDKEKPNNDENISKETTQDEIPGYLHFQQLKPLDNLEEHNLFKEHLKSDTETYQMLTTLSQVPVHETEHHTKKTCIIKSRIPVQQRVRNVNMNKLLHQTRWKKPSRNKNFDWMTRHWICRNKYKRLGARKSCSTTAIAERSLLNIKLERMFRDFSKKIYRGNIIDHNSHSRWMRLAGIVEEEDATAFKAYAKLKVCLTLAEYKEALLKMCEDHDWDYWEIIKKITNVQIRGTVSSTAGDDRCDIEENEF